MDDAAEKEIIKLVGDLDDQIRKIDPFITQVLQAHFLIEELTEAVLEALAKSPEHLELKRNPSFAQKVKWIRAFAPFGNDKHWRLILAVNTLRNKVAHKFDGPERKNALLNLRKEFEQYLKSEGEDFNDQEWADYNIVFASTMQSRVFLAKIWAQIKL